MKIITSLILSGSVVAISLSFGTKAIANNLPNSATIPTTILVAQNGDSAPNNQPDKDNSEKGKENEGSICLFDGDRFCLANKIFDEEKQDYIEKPNFAGHALLAIASGLIIGSTFIILNIYGIYLSNKWIDGVRDKNSSKFSVETTDLPKTIHESIKNTERLEQQLREIQIRISRHKEFMLYFYRQHFISISMTSGLALVAGICLIFITNVGIKDVNPALINIFLTTASAGLLYQRLPALFKQELNREANRSLFLKYNDLGNTILSYLSTGEVRDNAQMPNKSFSTKLDADKFVHFIDRELARLNQLPIEFDATKIIKITDLQESIHGAFNSGERDTTTPGVNGGDTTTPGVNGGDTTTPGVNGGDTTTPGVNGGDTTTPGSSPN